MSALEQSLDAIISQKTPARKPASRRTVKGSKRPQIASKSFGNRARNVIKRRPIPVRARASASPINRNLPSGPKPKAPPAAAASLDVATKVIVSGLPKDIGYETIKEFFTSSVGPVQKITLSYNEKGRSTGVATVIFKNASSARKAVATYNNSPIDSGRNILKLELVVDTTKVPLAARIRPNVQPATPNPLRQKIQARNSVHIPKGRPVKPNRAVSRNKKLAPKKQPKKKKTIEELDQEMADYFANNDK